MTELREFARHSDDLAKIGVRLVPISVDNQQHAREVWEKVAEKKFTVLSDPGANTDCFIRVAVQRTAARISRCAPRFCWGRTEPSSGGASANLFLTSRTGK